MDAAQKIVSDADFRIRYLSDASLVIARDAIEAAIEHGEGDLKNDALCIAQMMVEQIKPLLPELLEAVLLGRKNNIKSS